VLKQHLFLIVLESQKSKVEVPVDCVPVRILLSLVEADHFPGHSHDLSFVCIERMQQESDLLLTRTKA
jgi:hypothetical protein